MYVHFAGCVDVESPEEQAAMLMHLAESLKETATTALQSPMASPSRSPTKRRSPSRDESKPVAKKRKMHVKSPTSESAYATGMHTPHGCEPSAHQLRVHLNAAESTISRLNQRFDTQAQTLAALRQELKVT